VEIKRSSPRRRNKPDGLVPVDGIRTMKSLSHRTRYLEFRECIREAVSVPHKSSIQMPVRLRRKVVNNSQLYTTTIKMTT
jgi:hypothetical protein